MSLTRLRTWFGGLSKVGRFGVITGATIVGLMGISAAANPQPTTQRQPQPTAQSSRQPSVETKSETTVLPIPFTSSTVQDANLAKGTDKVTTAGVNGAKTQTWEVTYTDGKETSRRQVSEVITTQPVNEVKSEGTYVAPAPAPAPTCTNGSYINSYGNAVCRPEAAPSAPSGATARCVDGTYSFSQSRSGTCSHHGGVSTWL